jgi:hypothetical protein
MMNMTEARKLLELLQAVVPGDTPVTISSEVSILEALGIVSSERALSAMRVASLLVPPDTPATHRGLVNTLTQLMRMNPSITEAHRNVIGSALTQAAQADDFQLTFGTFLPICQSFIEAKGKPAGSTASEKRAARSESRT